MPVPLGLDHPRWVDDPDFDLGDHLHRTALPSPAGQSEWQAKVAEVMGRPLTPDQPPWEMHLVEGMAGQRVGLIAKVHHTVIDGVAGATMLAHLLDLTPGGWEVTHPSPAWRPPQLPSAGTVFGDALPHVLQSPLRAWRAAREVGRTAVRLTRCALDERTGPLHVPLGAPLTFEETAVRARRAVAFAELAMADVKALKDRYGATVNDVILAVCSGALRTHLERVRACGGPPAGGRRPRLDPRRGGRRRGQPALGHVRAVGQRPPHPARAVAGRHGGRARRAGGRSRRPGTGPWPAWWLTPCHPPWRGP